MRRPTRREVGLAMASVILVALILLWTRGCGPVARASSGAGDASLPTPFSFMISGDVSRPITPGELVLLDLTLDNASDLDLAIDRITVAVVGIDAPLADTGHPCSAADFHVRNLSNGPVLRLAGNSVANLSGLKLPEANWPAVGMLNRPVNQDGCKGASLTLSYEASGTEVPR